MKIYIVNGAKESGKTTFEKMVQEVMGEHFCQIFSTIDFVKDLAKQCGWDGTKNAKNRKFLSDLKDLLTQWDNVPLKDVQRKIGLFKYSLEYYGMGEDAAVFVDCREPEEIEKLKEALNAKTIIIRRDSAEQEPTSNHADANILNYNYDIIINNNSNLYDLTTEVLSFMEKEKLHNWDELKQLKLEI